MARFVLKFDKDRDAYAEFSTVVDGFVSDPMTREQMFARLREEMREPDELIEARLVRADLTGTSSKDGAYGWDDGSVLILDGGACEDIVARDQLYSYVTGTVS